MKIYNLLVIQLMVIGFFGILTTSSALAATSATLSEADSYSVLGNSVTCAGSSTVERNVGTSPGSSITGFSSPCVVGPLGSTHSADASASLAQADNVAAFTYIDQSCDVTYNGVQDLSLVSPLSPGTYCSTGSFTLSGNLTLTGSGVWIFKSASTIITSPGSSVTGGNSCNIWWRALSSVTLDTTTSFKGNVLALTAITMNNGASLNGRIMAQNAAVTLNNNIITTDLCNSIQPTPTVAVSPTPIITSIPTPTVSVLATPISTISPTPVITDTPAIPTVTKVSNKLVPGLPSTDIAENTNYIDNYVLAISMGLVTIAFITYFVLRIRKNSVVIE